MIQVKTFYAHNDLRNFSYLLFNDQTGESWVIDPYEAGPIENYIRKNGLNLRGILNTHGHHDHVRGNGPLSEAFKSPIQKLHGGETIALDKDHGLSTMDTPGHTMDHQVFFLEKHGHKDALFSGDTLFNAGVGNCKNGGNIGDLFKTTQKLLKLPADIILYPGHDYIQRNLEFAKSLEPENSHIEAELNEVKSEDVEKRRPRTLGEEFSVNPFFRLESHEIRQNMKENLNLLENETQIERNLFEKIRSLRDQW
jgi:hydroxyacylglutathione hydrolase